VHVVEVAHHGNAGVVDVAADGGGIGELAQEEGFAPVEGLHQDARVALLGVVADLLE
jgi:hypothetical protein